MQLFGTDLLKTYWAHDVKMTSMRRYVASTSLRRHVPVGNLAPPCPPPPPNILNLAPPTPPQYSKPSYAYDSAVFHTFSIKLRSLILKLFFFHDSCFQNPTYSNEVCMVIKLNH